MLNRNHLFFPALTLAFVWSYAPMVCIAQGVDDVVKQAEPKDDPKESMNKGREYIGEKNYEAAVKEFQNVVKKDPKNGIGWQLLGYSLHLSGDLDNAIEAHKKASEFDDGKLLGLYNLGCAYSLKKDLDKAFEYLNKAVAAGFHEMNYFDTDTDLDNLRKDPRFAKVVARAKNGGREPLEKKLLTGEWHYKSGKRAGLAVPPERLNGGPIFSDNKVEIPAGPDAKFIMAFKIKETSKNTEIDLTIESGPAPDGKALGIIKLEDGLLTLCYDPEGKKRPSKFESTADNGFFLFAMEKNEKDKKANESK